MSKFQSSSTTATPLPPLNQTIHFKNGSTFEHSESNFWSKQFALGTSGTSHIDPNSKTSHHAKHIVFPTKSNFPIQSISFRPCDDRPQQEASFTSSLSKQMAVGSGPRVALHPLKSTVPKSISEIQPDRNIPMADIAYCTDYRADGRLLAIGCADGSIKVVDITTRATLKTFQAKTSSTSTNQLGIRSVTWGRDGKKIISGGEDAVLRIWDLGGEDSSKALRTLKGHADAIRVCKLAKISGGIDGNSASNKASLVAVTGSYDHTLRLWDLTKSFYDEVDDNQADDSDACLAVMDHGAPVEDVIIVPSELIDNSSSSNSKTPLVVISAGGTMIKMWNALTGSLLATVSNHAKTISTLCLVTPQQLKRRKYKQNDNTKDEDEIKLPRLITGGLDGLVRIYSLSTATNALTILHGFKHGSPITTIEISPDGMRLTIGSTDGLLSIFYRTRAQQMREQKLENQKKRKRTVPKGGTYSFFMRGGDSMPEPNDVVIFKEKKKRLKKFDFALRQFRYSDALDEALGTKNPLVVS